MDDLKPCPFGCPLEDEAGSTLAAMPAGVGWIVMCDICQCDGPFQPTEAEAIAAWNARAALEETSHDQ